MGVNLTLYWGLQKSFLVNKTMQIGEKMNFQRILDFWFKENSKNWFVKSDGFDDQIKSNFLEIHSELSAGEHQDWKADPHSMLAMIIVLDQFPRNMFRNDKKSFASDPPALSLAREMVAKGFDKKLTPIERVFVYLPFEHSEDIEDQEKSVRLFAELKAGDENLDSYWDFAKRHYEIILKFKRFPHRNQILGRKSTPEEIEFLKEPGSAF